MGAAAARMGCQCDCSEMRSTQNVNQATSVYVEALAELTQTAIQTRPLGMQALDFSKQNLELIRGSGHVEEWLRHVFPGDRPIETKEGIQQVPRPHLMF